MTHELLHIQTDSRIIIHNVILKKTKERVRKIETLETVLTSLKRWLPIAYSFRPFLINWKITFLINKYMIL